MRAQNQPDLWEAVSADADLLELTRTPLLLNLLRRAVGEEDDMVARNLPQITSTNLCDLYIFDLYIKQRFAQESRKRSLPYNEPTTRILLGKIGAFMWQDDRYPKAELDAGQIDELPGRQKREFIHFAQSMHFLHQDSAGAVRFIHTRFRDYCAVSALVEALNHREGEVRWNAVETLAHIDDPVTVPALKAALRHTENYVRVMAAEALIRVHDPAAVPVLIQALTSLDSYRRERAVEALAQIHDIAVVEALKGALTDSDWDVRWKAAEALRRMGQELPA